MSAGASSVFRVNATYEHTIIKLNQFIDNDQYENAQQILRGYDATIKFLHKACFSPLLKKDFQKNWAARNFFLVLVRIFPEIKIHGLYRFTLRNQYAFNFLLSHFPLTDDKTIRACFEKIIEKNYCNSCRILIRHLATKNISLDRVIGIADENTTSLFVKTLKENKWTIFKAFIENLSTLEGNFTGGNNLLHTVTQLANSKALKRIFKFIPHVARKAINEVNDEDQSPLMCSIRSKDLPSLVLLIQNGADFSKKYGEMTPLELAEHLQWKEAIKLLNLALMGVFSVAEDIEKDSSLGKTVIHRKEEGLKLLIAKFQNNEKIPVDIVEALEEHIEEGWIDLDIPVDEQGNTLFCFAALNGFIDICELLKEHSADVTIANRNGKTPLMLASQFAHIEVLKFFEKNYPEEFASKNEKGKTAIFYLLQNLEILQKENSRKKK